MGHQQLYWSHPRKFGQGSRSCRVCSNRHGLIRKYGLNMCRQCFRQYANDIGFVKASICVVLSVSTVSHGWLVVDIVLYGNVSGKGIPASECRGQVFYQS
uniref:Small ribosomal subunit protein uS14 n=1 Tax=Oncorhynchus kisutch TaxID=8019 RepID=A0A8C7INH3_ONCKI